MRKVKYLINRIIKLDYKNMIKIVRNISKKTHKSFIFLFIDVIYCGFKYQAGYYDYQEFEFYNLNKKERRTYLTRGINNEIVRKYNDKKYFYIFDDKITFDTKFNKFLKRDWMYLKDNEKEFIEFFKKHKNIIVKPSDGVGGKGIELLKYENESNSIKVYKELLKKGQNVIEEVIIQNKEMSKLYDKSVNTLRIFTFVKDEKSYFLQAILKIGNGSVVDNFSSGGMYSFVSDEGIVYVSAIDMKDNIHEIHPITKEKIVGFKVPMFKEAVEMALEAAKVIKEVQYVGWDIAVSNKGPVIVEGNCFPGVFQVKPSLSGKKEGLIPKYRKYMDF